ncbi:arylsulfatase [Draconibacterium sediminis]|uniref:Arylsulfatase n=1 Tax=Draconibacterium sediminis TaxID=1544798 RepID=A0A0D8JF63_9BACT|nr:arylsulfatase [Draconibacterium sediminis]KJF45349.1 arylsulfatase [Draconibacterium sediminis]
MMNFGKIIPVFMAAILLAACQPTGKTADSKTVNKETPNIIYILADDLGYGDLGCYQQKIIKTPHIDQLAQNGMKFTQHYCGSSVCAPSRSSLLTGQDTGHTPIRGNKEVQPEGQAPLPAESVTIAELLKNAGYITGAFGKWGLGYPGSEGDPNHQGFDEFFGYNCQRMAHRYYPEYIWHNQEKIYLEGNGWKNTVSYAQDVIQEATLEFIENNKDTAFFAFIPYILPHAELISPDDSLLQQYSGEFSEIAFEGSKGADYGDSLVIWKYCSQRQPRATFASMVSRLDVYVGQVVEKLNQLGLAENTIIMFASDNGPHQEGGADPDFFDSNGELRGYKRDLYEGGIRTPFIVSWPGKIEAGSVSDHISAFWDVMPTVAELAGVTVNVSTNGISFLPELLADTANQPKHEYLYWEFHERGGRKAVRMGDWKGVQYNLAGKKSPEIQLFNLAKDIGEQENLASQYPDIVEKISDIMNGARISSDDFNFSMNTLNGN